MSEQEQAIVNAVMYAIKEGCFFPVQTPKVTAPVRQWVQWGAMRNLHTAIAEYSRAAAPGGRDA